MVGGGHGVVGPLAEVDDVLRFRGLLLRGFARPGDQPLTGQQFTKSLLTPISPAAVMALVQAGWPVDITFRVAVRSINGIQAGTRGRMLAQAEDPRFGKLLEALRRLQQKGNIAIRVAT